MNATLDSVKIENIEPVAEKGDSFRRHWYPTSDEAIAQQTLIETFIEASIPLILWGEPGKGKTQTVRSAARKLGYDLIIVIGSRKEPTFLEGIPIVVKPSDAEIANISQDESLSEAQKLAAIRPRTVNALPDWYEYAVQNSKTLIFWDEIGSVSEDVQAAMLSVVEEREIDGVKLPDEVRFIAAGNDIDQAANGQYLAPPFANRWGHLDFDLPVADWVDGFRQNFGNPADPRLLEELARLSGYLNTNPRVVDAPVPTSPEESGKAWASRRTWTKLAQVLSKTDPNARVVRDRAIAAMIGLEQGNAFKTWDASLNFPPIDEMLQFAQDEKHDFGQYETDKLYAMLAYALNFVTKENLPRVVDFFVRCSEVNQATGFVMAAELGKGLLDLYGLEKKDAGKLPKEVFELLGKLSKSYRKAQEAGNLR